MWSCMFVMRGKIDKQGVDKMEKPNREFITPNYQALACAWYEKTGKPVSPNYCKRVHQQKLKSSELYQFIIDTIKGVDK